nr:MAG TPA: hypothetical protein [Bacteriophage sp.]
MHSISTSNIVLFFDSAFTYQPAAVGLLGLVTFLGSIKEKSYNNIVC